MFAHQPKGAFGSPGAGVIVRHKSPNVSSRVEAKYSVRATSVLTSQDISPILRAKFLKKDYEIEPTFPGNELLHKKNASFNSCQKWCFKEDVTTKHRDELCWQSFLLEVHKPHHLADGLSHWCWDPIRVKSERQCKCKGKLVLKTWKSCPHSHMTAPIHLAVILPFGWKTQRWIKPWIPSTPCV